MMDELKGRGALLPSFIFLFSFLSPLARMSITSFHR